MDALEYFELLANNISQNIEKEDKAISSLLVTNNNHLIRDNLKHPNTSREYHFPDEVRVVC